MRLQTLICSLCLCLCLCCASAASGQCRQALALGLDVSGSVDSREYRLQLSGLAAALGNGDIRAAILTTPDVPVHLAIYEWSGTDHQRVLVSWTPIRNNRDLDTIIDRLRRTSRTEAPPGTALGAAMRFGAALLNQQQDCWKRTLDISGDGKDNQGAHPRNIRSGLEAAGLTVNALVIGADAPASGDLRQVEIAELSSYFRAWVITGPDAFVETALGFEGYEAAMTRKLKRELQSLVLSRR